MIFFALWWLVPWTKNSKLSFESDIGKFSGWSGFMYILFLLPGRSTFMIFITLLSSSPSEGNSWSNHSLMLSSLNGNRLHLDHFGRFLDRLLKVLAKKVQNLSMLGCRCLHRWSKAWMPVFCMCTLYSASSAFQQLQTCFTALSG